MKSKTLIPVLGIIAIILAGSACTPKMTMQATSHSAGMEDPSLDKGVREPLFLNEVNAKVLRNFYRSYGEMPSAKWFRSGNDFRVVFVSNEMNHSIYYRQNGLLDARIISYAEGRMPQQVRHFVKSRFYDFAITHVTEVQKSGKTAFYVKLEDSSVIRTIKIADEEWEEVESFFKI